MLGIPSKLIDTVFPLSIHPFSIYLYSYILQAFFILSKITYIHIYILHTLPIISINIRGQRKQRIEGEKTCRKLISSSKMHDFFCGETQIYPQIRFVICKSIWSPYSLAYFEYFAGRGSSPFFDLYNLNCLCFDFKSQIQI